MSRFENAIPVGTTPDGERIEHIGTVDPDISPDDFQAFVEGDKPAATMATKKGEGRRLRFEHEGRLVYEWEQSLDEVNIYITPPEGLSAKMIEVDIKHGHLRIGIKGQAEGIAYIDEDTWGKVKVDDSLWTLEDGELNINLTKMVKAEVWEAALLGKDGATVDLHTREELKKTMLKDRFQEEHPGFDFSGAEINGNIPSAKEFMGGLKNTSTTR